METVAQPHRKKAIHILLDVELWKRLKNRVASEETFIRPFVEKLVIRELEGDSAGPAVK
jgi:hypothetical protein